MANEAFVAGLVDRLQHPDAVVHQEVVDEIVALGPEAIPTLAANMAFVSPRVRRAIVTVFGRMGDAGAVLPLMRYVHDERDSLEERDGRAIAMQVIAKLSPPENARRLFGFIKDVRHDADPFVRAYAAEALAGIGDRRVIPLLEDMVKDPEEFVREKAAAGLASLPDEGTDALEQESISDEVLLQRIRETRGPDRAFFVEELRSRSNRFELARALTLEGGGATIHGLQALLEVDDSRGREAAGELLKSQGSELDPAHAAVALRLMARYLDGDAAPDEIESITSWSRHSDSFVRLAAAQAAGASGDLALMRGAVDLLGSRNPELSLAAAQGLSRGLTGEHRTLLPKLQSKLAEVRKQRRGAPNRSVVRAEAYLLRALGSAASGGGFGTHTVGQDAMTSLQAAAEHHPILVTALDLLEMTTPEEGLPESRRWTPEMTAPLVPLMTHQDDEVRRRALGLLIRGAPTGFGPMAKPLSTLLFESAVDIEHVAVPLLIRVGNAEAKRLLQELAEHSEDHVRVLAEAALRRLRNANDYLDAEFE